MLDRWYMLICLFALVAMFGGGLIGRCARQGQEGAGEEEDRRH
jgi:hypothetical protein